MNYWLLNSAVIAVNGDGDYEYRTIDRPAAVAWLQAHAAELISRIGYPDNVNFIYAISGVPVNLSRDESRLQPGDEALVVRPAYRQTSGSNKGSFQPRPEDFVFGLLRRLS